MILAQGDKGMKENAKKRNKIAFSAFVSKKKIVFRNPPP
jgi:hypothetical protein